MSDDNTQTLRNFYLFWKWEYIKRCDVTKLYCRGFFSEKAKAVTCAKDLYMGFRKLTGEGTSIKEILNAGLEYRTYELDIFKFTILESRVNYYFDKDATKILNSIMDKQLIYIYPNVDLGYNAAMPLTELIEDFSIFENTTDWELHRVTQEDITKKINEWGYLVLIDNNADIDVVVDEIKKIHLGSDKEQLNSHINKLLKGICLENSNEPRAVGLWMWDYITEKYGPGKPPHGKIAEARRELEKNFDISKLGYADSRPETIENKYRRTCECIEACEVLPF